MAKRWEQFEQDVARIAESLGKTQGAELICFGRDCKVLGKSGLKRQVDVLLRIPTAYLDLQMVVSCKDWKKPVPPEDIDTLWAVMEDAGIQIGAVASRKGFTSGAKTVAENRGILLWRLDDPDWEDKIKIIEVQIHLLWPEIHDFEFLYEDSEPSNSDSKQQSHAKAGNLIVKTPGQPDRVLDDIIQARIANAVDGTIELDFPVGTEVFSKTHGKGRRIKGAVFELRTTEHVRDVVVDGGQVIAKEFENVTTGQRFAIDHNWNMTERSQD